MLISVSSPSSRAVDITKPPLLLHQMCPYQLRARSKGEHRQRQKSRLVCFIAYIRPTALFLAIGSPPFRIRLVELSEIGIGTSVVDLLVTERMDGDRGHTRSISWFMLNVTKEKAHPMCLTSS